MRDKIIVIAQRLIPQHLLSRCLGWLADKEVPIVTHAIIRWFVRRYNVCLSEASREHVNEYKTFNDFFTRTLKPDARPFTKNSKALICPADGAISQACNIQSGTLLQAKGKNYTVESLLIDKNMAAQFASGLFTTIYLSPRDYHRVHMPCDAVLRKMIYVPGDLFSVNPVTTRACDQLFARNERAVCFFDTQHGPLAMVMVGAMIVAGIHVAWHGKVAPGKPRSITSWDYKENEVVLSQGDEMGLFCLGSTVIMLTSSESLNWLAHVKQESSVRLGELLT